MPFEKGEIPEGAQPFKPGDPRINRNGRPRKMVSQVLEDLKDADIEAVSKQQVIGAIEMLLNCQEDDLKQYKDDESHSMLIRIVAEHLLDSKDSDRVLNMLLDRAFGKSTQKMDHTSSDGSMSPPSNLQELYDEERNAES